MARVDGTTSCWRRHRGLVVLVLLSLQLSSIRGAETDRGASGVIDYLVDHISWTDTDTGDCSSGSDSCVEPHVITVRLKERDDILAREVAAQHGFRVVGRPFLNSVYFLQHLDPTPGKDGDHTRRKRALFAGLASNAHVVEASEQRSKRRTKRDFLEHDEAHRDTDRAKRSGVGGAGVKTPVVLPWRDPLYNAQWYLHGGAIGGFDMNVLEAWRLGYSGKGVSVSILDDGIQTDHADLKRNYDADASSDINDHDDDPTPQHNGDNKHGTRCAGEVASVAGNDECGVGAAFDASIGGVRMLDGPVSDSVEAASLSLNPQHIDVYSASWGPEDDGRTFDGPGPLAREAFYKGISEGRGGRGSIFVWASGNGGSHRDSCSADGYTTSIYTLSISSATYDNKRPWYLEECPSSIATTYSSAMMNQPAIVTVDVPQGCTDRHTGTSASAPLAAGIIALALEANGNLTWRDMQHAVLRTANPTALLSNAGWLTNAVGRKVSNKFGYGLMDAGALVKLVRTWRTVPKQEHCAIELKMPTHNGPVHLAGKFSRNFTLEVTSADCAVRYLEHVQAVVTIRYSRRGDIRLWLQSPMGTRPMILPLRSNDNNRNGFHKWPFLSVQQWGENPIGTWTLTIESDRNALNTGTFHDWSLIVYGTATPAQPGDATYAGGATTPTASIGVATSEDEEPSSQQTGSTPASVGDCHAECDAGGCHEKQTATACFRCRHYNVTLRNKSAFTCVAQCPEDYYAESVQGRSFCRQCARTCAACSSAESCDRCETPLLLVDVDFGHFHHGQCVQTCPEGLVLNDDDSAVRRCVRPSNPCSPGRYYDDARRVCLACAAECAECCAPGPIGCTSCARGYGKDDEANGGYCRPCCKYGESAYQRRLVAASTGDGQEEHCVDCRVATSKGSGAVFGFRSGQILLVMLGLAGGALALFALLFVCFSYRDRHHEKEKPYSYQKLPTRIDLSSIGGASMKASTKNGANGNGLTADDLGISTDEEDDHRLNDLLTARR